MLAGESARASKMPARRPMAYSPRGGSPVISGLVPAGGDVGGAAGDQASISSTPAGSRVRQNVRSRAARTAIPAARPWRHNGGSVRPRISCKRSRRVSLKGGIESARGVTRLPPGW